MQKCRVFLRPHQNLFSKKCPGPMFTCKIINTFQKDSFIIWRTQLIMKGKGKQNPNISIAVTGPLTETNTHHSGNSLIDHYYTKQPTSSGPRLPAAFWPFRCYMFYHKMGYYVLRSSPTHSHCLILGSRHYQPRKFPGDYLDRGKEKKGLVQV